MIAQYTVFAADYAALVSLLTDHGVLTQSGSPRTGVGYAYRGNWSISGSAMTSVCALFWWEAPAADAGEAAERTDLLDALRSANALYEGLEQPIYIAGTSGYQRPVGWDWIKRERDARKLACGFKVGANWFHSDPTSRGQQLGLVIAAGAGQLPPGLQWKTMSGSFVTMNAQLAMGIFASAMQSDMLHHAVAEQARVAFEAGALTDLTTIAWPTAYAP